jgi:hypothetical protein
MIDFSSRISEKLERATTRFLQHRCTHVTYEAVLDEDDEPVLDEGGHPTYEENTESSVPCLFLWKDVSTTSEIGTAIEKRPTLYVLASHDISEGDIIRNVLARNTTVLLATAKIKTIDPTAEGGNASLKVCELEGVVM